MSSRRRRRDPSQGAAGALGVRGPVEIVSDVPRLTELENDWRHLAELRGNAFITPEWFRTWMRHYGQAAEPRVVVVCDREGAVRGVVPLVQTRQRGFKVHRFAGSPIGDVYHPACVPHDQDEVAAIAIAALGGERGRSATFVLDHVETAAPWWRHTAATGLGALRAQVVRDDVMPLIEFGELDWDGYLATRSRNLRSQVRRRLRALAADDQLSFRLTTEIGEVKRDVATLFRLHDLRWDELGGSSASTGLSRAFHADFAAAALQRGWLRLWFLELDGEPIAGWYGWRLGSRYSYYQAGFDPRFKDRNVGFSLLAHTMRSAVQEGAADYDLLLGAEEFKWRFATTKREISTAVLAPRSHPVSVLARTAASIWRLSQRLPPRVRGPAKALYRRVTRASPTTARS